MVKKGDKSDGPTRTRTSQLKQKMIRALRAAGGNVTSACKAADVHRATHYRWLESDPAYAALVSEINSELCDAVESYLYDLIFSADKHSERVRAAEIYLKARAKDRGYGVEKRDQSVSGDLNVSATVQKVVFEIPSNGTEPGTDPPMPPGWEAATGGGLPG